MGRTSGRTQWRLALLLSCGSLLGLAAKAPAQGFFPRGDANCSLASTAADAVAVSRSAGGSVCDNDDCNRDGVIDDDDIDCGIQCLFDECPTPPNAPEIAGIELETGEDLTPFTTIHVIGNNLGAADRIKRVTFDGVDAEVIELIPPDELVVLVPSIEPGLVEIAIHDGDLVGMRVAIDIAAQVPIGQPDSLEATFDLLDTVAARFTALPLEGHYGDDAILVGSAIEAFREELAQQRAALVADPSFTPVLRAALDAAFDSSSVPDDLREVLADIEAIEDQLSTVSRDDGGRGAQAAAVANVAGKWSRTLRIARGVVALGGAAAATGLSAPAAAVSVLTGVVAGVVTLAGSAALPPIILGVTFSTASAQAVGGPTPGGFAVVRGQRLIGTNFVLQVAGGAFVIPPQFDNDTTRQFQLPGDAVGFCGRAKYYLERSFPLAGRSAVFPDGVIPQLEAFVGPNPVVPGDELRMRVRGVSGCVGTASFADAQNNRTQVGLEALTPTLAETRVPNGEPGPYSVYLIVDGRRGERLAGLTLESGVRAVVITCTPATRPRRSDLVLPPGSPASASCEATTVPTGAFRPQFSYFSWTSSNPGTAPVVVSPDSERSVVDAKLPGATEITAALKVENQSFASSTTSWGVTVEDTTAPAVVLSSSSPASVTAGTPISVRVRATDNFAVSRVRITATGDAVLNGPQESTCLLQKTCSVTFAVNTSATFDRNQVAVVAQAFDSSGNMGTSAQLSFTVTEPEDEICPSVTISSPPNGGTVNAGSANQVVAHATDEVGVKRFRYSAAGDALVANVGQELTFPDALMSADLRFNLTVKNAADLENVSNRTITIMVEALDAIGNTCPQTATVSVIGVLDACQGSVTTDNPLGFIGEPFTVTVTLTGASATEVTRVTSINPGGQFELTQDSSGVWKRTLFYQGTGRFTLSFTAFDGQGNSRCSGSIGLESLGPEP